MTSKKQFKIPAERIKDLARGYGGCIATDRITVDGELVGYMYREAPAMTIDSGWRFFSGTESQEYLDDPDNSQIYDVNTIANYDAAIIDYLDAPIGSHYEREEGKESFRVAQVN